MSTVQKSFGQASRILIAPDQRLPDDFVLVRVGEMLPKKSLTSFLVDERGERSHFRSLPGVQLDRKRTLINASLKRWRIPQIFAPTDTTLHRQCNSRETSLFSASTSSLSKNDVESAPQS
jgi:hypothetical protein